MYYFIQQIGTSVLWPKRLKRGRFSPRMGGRLSQSKDAKISLILGLLEGGLLEGGLLGFDVASCS